MINSYLRLVIRQFLNDKLHTFIVVVGLAIGIASALIIGQYIHFELNFDKSVKDLDDIYYSYVTWTSQGVSDDSRCFPAVAPFAKSKIPEIKSAVRLAGLGISGKTNIHLRREEQAKIIKSIPVNNLYFTDPEFFEFFSIPLIKGGSQSPLKEPHTVVLTKTLADKLFHGEDPIDKVVTFVTPIRTKEESIVTGVVDDPAPNSSLQYGALFSFETLKQAWRNIDETWSIDQFETYLKLHPAADFKRIEAKLNEAAATPIGNYEKQLNTNIDIRLTPFSNFHFFRHHNSTTTKQIQFTGDRRLLSYLGFMGMLIILISWANYINLSTAKAISRAKEVSLRKISGATRCNLIIQFFLEFLFLNVISILLALTFTQLLFGVFANIIGSEAEWIFWTKPIFWILLLLLTLLSTVISGVYPAIVISEYKPIKVLKGNFSRSQSGSVLRKGLVIFQFALSVFMLMSIYVITRQLYFMQNKDLGISTDQVVVIPTQALDPSMDRGDVARLLSMKFKNDSHFESVTSASNFPGEGENRTVVFYRHNGLKKMPFSFEGNIVRENYFTTMGITLIYGRDFLDNQDSDTAKVIINERAAIELGFMNPAMALGESVMAADNQRVLEIIGVVKDFNINLKIKGSGEIFYHYDIFSIDQDAPFRVILIKLSNENIRESMAIIDKQWQTLFGDMPLDFFFLDNYFDTFYRQEQQFAGVLGYFAIIGIFVTCMGLFGLSLYESSSRSKEIGIRKTLGASVHGIMWLFSKDYLKLIFIAVLISIPLAYLVLTEWLSNYPEHIKLQPDAILIPALILCAIAIATVAYQIFKIAHVNPVSALRND